MSIPLLPTKLYAPPLRTQLLRRPALTAKLNRAELRPLTLIAAPAGFGKTTLVTEWLTQGEQRAAWLSLAEDDNDVTVFLTYVLAALRTIAAADLGESVLVLLQAPQPPPLRALLHTLAHELISGLPPCVLVLDDYHVISDHAIHEAVLFLLDHVPALRWIINTRADPALPLGRLRARQQLLELRAADLRFSVEETTRLLNEIMHFALPDNAVQELQTKTEGWIAGLQLAGLAMQSNPDHTQFIHDFYGSHRYVADYLADEVLRHLPEQTQAFLLQTALLERLCTELCEAVVIKDEENISSFILPPSSLILEELERANLFLIPLDDNRRWYRYHQLFADLLRQRLQRRYPHLVPLLHQRAAAWFAQHDLVDDAMRHLIAAKAFTQAADLLEQRNELLWMQGRFVLLHHWLTFLPDEMIAQRPRLVLAQAWTHVLSDAAASTVTTLFQQAEAAIVNAAATDTGDRQPSTTELQGVLAAIRAVYHSKQEEVTGVIANAQQALTYVPATSGSWRSIALLCLGFAYEMKGDVRAAEQTFLEALRLCQLIGNHYSALVTARSLGRTYIGQGKLRLAAATYTQALNEATHRGLGQLPNIAHVHINLGRLHYEWNDLTAAVAQLQLGLARLQGQESGWIGFEGYVLLARAKHAQGDSAAAIALLHQAEQVAQAIPFPWTKVATASALVRTRLALGQESAAAQWLAQAQPTLTADFSRVREGEQLTAARVLLVQGQRGEALALLTPLGQDAETAGRMKIVVESCILMALAYERQGAQQAAQDALGKALTLAEPEGYIRSFVDEGEALQFLILDFRLGLAQQPPTEQNVRLSSYVDKLLAGFGYQQAPATEALLDAQSSIQNHQSKIQNLIEPLSARELELLHLMAAGLSNQEIADRLIITLGTVKSHANHIFGKVGVQGRVKAINRARELALI